jgi:hypothetical protein
MARVREISITAPLNDRFRKREEGEGAIAFTKGLSKTGAEFMYRALQAVRHYPGEEFTKYMCREHHDYGLFTLDGHELYWEITARHFDPQKHEPGNFDYQMTVIIAFAEEWDY